MDIKKPSIELNIPPVLTNGSHLEHPPPLNGGEEIQVNHSYLLAYTSLLMLASNIGLGMGYTETGQSNFVFSQQLGWEEAGTSAQNYTYVSLILLCGITVGANLGPKLIKLNGKRRVSRLFLLLNALFMLFSCLKLVLYFPVFLIGRFW